METKLKVVFNLIAVALFGIIVFQVYWTFNAYQVNKEKFDTNVNIAMQKAMDDCKKDYFDSVRRVLVRRLSPPETTIKIDTLHEADTVNIQLTIHLSNKYVAFLNPPFHITAPMLDFYRKKIDHKATIPEVLTETSFYMPGLMNNFTLLLGSYDIQSNGTEFRAFYDKNRNEPPDSMRKFDAGLKNSIYQLPDNYRVADSLKMHHYFSRELQKMNINPSFNLAIATKSVLPLPPSGHYTETTEFEYKYHGFVLFHIAGPDFFVHAVFKSPQYAVLKGMLLLLILSILLVVFTIYAFYYIFKTINDQKKLAELKDDFINNMTHELKTPIATIEVAIEGLQNFNALNDPEKVQRYLQTSRNELSRLNLLVNKVLDIAAFENNQINLVKKQVNINNLINDVITSEQQKTDKTVKFSYANDSHVELIKVDPADFRSVLVNLIDNAVKYSGDPVEITINCFKQENILVIAVKDNGIGIPPAHLDLVFEKFHRVPTGNLHTVKGTGLGLSYVRYIVEAHGGTISLKSEINRGSEFIVSLPLGDG